GPNSVISNAAAPSSLPTNRLPSRSAAWSTAPETTMPYRCHPYRPRSCTVVSNPGSRTSIIGPRLRMNLVMTGRHGRANALKLASVKRYKAQVITGLEQHWRVVNDIEQPHRRATDDAPATGTCQGVYAGLIACDADRTGRHPCTRR